MSPGRLSHGKISSSFLPVSISPSVDTCSLTYSDNGNLIEHSPREEVKLSDFNVTSNSGKSVALSNYAYVIKNNSARSVLSNSRDKLALKCKFNENLSPFSELSRVHSMDTVVSNLLMFEKTRSTAALTPNKRTNFGATLKKSVSEHGNKELNSLSTISLRYKETSV